MSKQTMTKSQLREAINGLGPLAPDWLVEALEDFIELQEAHKNLLAMHAEDAYHLEEARAKLSAPQVSPVVPDETKKLYNELLYAVASKFPNETRHQTALRYIRNADGISAPQASPVKYQYREIGESDWRDCTKEQYALAKTAPELDYRTIEQSPIDEHGEFKKWWSTASVDASLRDAWFARAKLSAPVAPDELGQRAHDFFAGLDNEDGTFAFDPNDARDIDALVAAMLKVEK